MYAVNDQIVVCDESNRIIVNLQNEEQIRQLAKVPNYGMKVINGKVMVSLPWEDASCRILNNIGLEAFMASPFWKEPHPKIEGKYDGMMHQLLTAAFIALNPRCYVLSDCRLGKTGSLILGMDYLQKRCAFAGGVLVITTVTTLRNVWETSIRQTLPEASVAVLHGKGKIQIERQFNWYVTNYDTIRLNVKTFEQAIREKRIGAVVIDELTHVGNSSSQRHKAIAHLTNDLGLEYIVGMTGSPGSNPEPVYGMARAVNPTKLPVRTKTGWMNLTTFAYGSEPYMRAPVSDCGKYIRAALTPAIRFKKEDVLDLPPITYQERDCSLTAEQRSIIEQFRADAIAYIEDNPAVTAANAAVVLSKLLQVPLGFVMSSSEKDRPIDINHALRTNVILDAVHETDRKVVIFSMFKHRLKTLQQELTDAGIEAEMIDGSVTGDRRAAILSTFQQENKGPKVLCAHPITVGFGTELSVADTIIFDGPPVLGNFVYSQSLERLSSPKQKASNINVIKVMATKEEREMFRRLDLGQRAGAIIAEMFEEFKNYVLKEC